MTDLDAYAAFLAARWDEIEQDLILRDTDAVGHALDCVYEGGWGGTSACDCGALDRARADLAAKRAILDLIDGGWIGHNDDNILGDILAQLAAPFRDHPDHPARQP